MAIVFIHIIGPGGAGKSTTGAALALKLGYDFIDLDKEYLKQSLIEDDIEKHGYPYYVGKNIDTYLRLRSNSDNTVMATSSGFMTYDPSFHSNIGRIRQEILECPHTVLLMPSFNRADCIEETVYRQLKKAHESNSVEAQRARISTRFPIYIQMGSIKVATDVPTSQVVQKIVAQKSCFAPLNRAPELRI